MIVFLGSDRKNESQVRKQSDFLNYHQVKVRISLFVFVFQMLQQ